MRYVGVLLLLLTIACSCSRTTNPARPADAQAVKIIDGLPHDIQKNSIGRMFFAVGGGRNSRTKELESDRAYRAFSVVLVRSQDAFRQGESGIYVIGSESSSGTEILKIVSSEAPWQQVPEHVQVAANHLVFSGALYGRVWEFSRAYPDPTIDRIVRSLRPILDAVPEAESQ